MKTKTKYPSPNKPAPDGTVYLTPHGTRVMLVAAKQSPYRENCEKTVVRVSDGHRLWGCNIETLKPE